MPRNGQGIYQRPAGTIAIPDTTILSSAYNSTIEDISEALSDSVNKDGTRAMSAALNMGGNKVVNAAAGEAPNDGATIGQLNQRAEERLKADIWETRSFLNLVAHRYNAIFSKEGNNFYGQLVRFETKGGGTQDGPQINFHKERSSYWSIGIKHGGGGEAGNFTFQWGAHDASAGKQCLMITAEGYLWSGQYGWLHERFAPLGAECVWNGGFVEFGAVDAGHNDVTVDCPHPYVMVGMRSARSNNGINVRGVKLRNY